MSYLNPIRLHFSGQFQADPSTVNNDVRHFNNDTFLPQFQQPQSGPLLNGWWEPDGGGAWRLVGCTVTMVGYKDGTTSTSDPVVGLAVADANARVAGKLVDLDPQQQMVSEIWGLIVRLTDGTTDSFSGNFDVAAFTDIWFRAPATGGDLTMGAFWESVIGPVTWGDTSSSPFLQQLQEAAPDGMLSIKLNVDGYEMDPTNANFTLGRVTGTIGPAEPNEPRHFVIGRHLIPASPSSPMNYMPAVIDTANRIILADFGNSLPTTSSGGPLRPIGTIELGYLDGANTFHSIGPVPYQSPGWYTNTAGVQPFPLTTDQLTALTSSSVAVAQNGSAILQENYKGLYARADQFVFRMDPGKETAAHVDVHLWATQYGQPLAGAKIVASYFPSGLQAGGSGLPDGLGPTPPFGTPEKKVKFPKSVPTDADGRAVLPIDAHDPENPRGYVDGQVYGILYLLADIAKQKNPALINASDFVSLLVHDAYVPPDEPTWYELLPIWQQYANLYPIMNRIVNLASYEDVVAHRKILSFAFGLPAEDPNHMPVTRDLSDGKREAILKFLGDPKRGVPPTPPLPPAERMKLRGGPPPKPPERRGKADPRDGGKTFALSMRPPFVFPEFDLDEN
jgi:hypothetical protein